MLLKKITTVPTVLYIQLSYKTHEKYKNYSTIWYVFDLRLLVQILLITGKKNKKKIETETRQSLDPDLHSGKMAYTH
jgi:hypothetical protein